MGPCLLSSRRAVLGAAPAMGTASWGRASASQATLAQTAPRVSTAVNLYTSFMCPFSGSKPRGKQSYTRYTLNTLP